MKHQKHRGSASAAKAVRDSALFLTLWCLSTVVHAYDAKHYCGEQGVWIQILGAGGPEIDDNHASASYIVWKDRKARLLIDPAPGSALLFDLAQGDYADLDAILITHLHVDHAGGLPAFVKGSRFGDREEPLRILGPSGDGPYPDTVEFVERLVGSQGAFAYLAGSLEGKMDGERLLPEAIPSKGRRVWNRFGTENLRVAAVPVNHGPVPAVAYRVDIDGERIVFTGDFNNEKNTLPAFAEGASALVIHHAIPESARGTARTLHIRPSQIGRLAATINPRFVVLGHRMSRTRGVESLSRQAIEESYDGSLLFASELECWGL